MVVASLIRGLSVKDAAAAAGVSRNTVYDWRSNKDPEFCALMEEAEQQVTDAVINDAVAASVAEVRALAPTAVAKLRQALGSEQPRIYLPAVAHVLRFLGAEGQNQAGLESVLAQVDANPQAGD